MTRTTTTRERLLSAAERLFLERGFHATSTRDITEAAGANLAAVNYYFRSKRELMDAVAERVIRPALLGQAEELDRLRARPGAPTVLEIARAYVGPFVRLTEGERGDQIARFVSRVMSEGTEPVRRATGPVEDRFRAELARALPGLSAEERELRFRAMVGVLLMYGLGLLTQHAPGTSPEQLTEQIAAFCAGGLASPPA
jgi:AcrR family transcriptional regulator